MVLSWLIMTHSVFYISDWIHSDSERCAAWGQSCTRNITHRWWKCYRKRYTENTLIISFLSSLSYLCPSIIALLNNKMFLPVSGDQSAADATVHRRWLPYYLSVKRSISNYILHILAKPKHANVHAIYAYTCTPISKVCTTSDSFSYRKAIFGCLWSNTKWRLISKYI